MRSLAIATTNAAADLDVQANAVARAEVLTGA